MTSREEISNWFDKGVSNGHRYMIIKCDTYDHEDFPVYSGETDYQEKSKLGSMERIMEVYDLTMDKEKQLRFGRTLNGPK